MLAALEQMGLSDSQPLDAQCLLLLSLFLLWWRWLLPQLFGSLLSWSLVFVLLVASVVVGNCFYLPAPCLRVLAFKMLRCVCDDVRGAASGQGGARVLGRPTCPATVGAGVGGAALGLPVGCPG